MPLARVRLGSLCVGRLVSGSNPISGFSHAGAERSARMLDYFTADNVKRYLRACEEQGIDGLVARADAFVARLLREYWNEGGHVRWIAQTAPEHGDPLRNIREAARAGAAAVYVHGGQVDRSFAAGDPDAVRRQLECVRGLGLPAGLAAHTPANLLAAQELGFPADFYLVCLYRIRGYQGGRGEERGEAFDDADRPAALAALARLRAPCLTYKVLAAGRKTLAEGLADVAPVLRPTDGVVVGMFPPDGPDLVRDNVRTFNRLLGGGAP
jgi:hypothetical protein